MKLSACRRPAFTLVELIVVIGIIALLATLSAAAVMRVQESQRESNTNNTLRKVQVGLDQQWKAARDTIAAEEPGDVIYAITAKPDGSRDRARAKALHMKLRLRQEFPQNYAEVRFVFPAAFAALNLQYGPKQIYVNAIGLGSGTPITEPQALLMIVLAQNRGGVSFNAEETGNVDTIDVGGKQMKVLLDAWRNPIALRRWASDSETDAGIELNMAPFVSTSALASGYKDPADPEGRLSAILWNNSTGLPGASAAAASFFTTPNPSIANPFDGTNRGPFVVSAGKDKNFSTADDLYSFRIQQAGRGN